MEDATPAESFSVSIGRLDSSMSSSARGTDRRVEAISTREQKTCSGARLKMTKVSAPTAPGFNYMNQYQADSDIAKSRYKQNFTSNIFDDPVARGPQKAAP